MDLNEQRRPNILFAIADDASHMSAYGHTFLNTPAFDAVAKEGVRFTRAFATNPKCAPSRASILTGMHTWQLEEACNHQSIFPAKFASYVDILEATGYFAGYTGKGWGPGDYEKGGWKRNPAGPEFNTRTLKPPADTKISNKDYAANFDDFLAQRPEGTPFYFWYGGHEPHRAYVPGEGIRAGKKISDVTVPAYLPDDDIVKSDLLDYAYETEWFDMHLGRMLQKLKDIGEYENTIIIVTSDNGMPFPRVKGQMYEFDFKLPLAVSWKNGFPGGRVIDDLVSFIDLAPTILDAAGTVKHPQMAGMSLMHMLRSHASGITEPSREYVLMGRERHDVGRENDLGYPVRCIRTHEYLYIRNFAPERWPAGNPETGYTNVDSSPTKELILSQHEHGEDFYYTLAFAKRPLEELYNIMNDEACMNNLASDPLYAEIKNKLWSRLAKELQVQNDPRIDGNGDIFESYEYCGAGATHSWKAYRGGYFEKQKY
ncbi:MAG: sulfatase [Spirochaetes bacterium]|nr:sulfatase [Spirochaetota bacterium]